MSDLISRADAVKAIRKCKFESVMPSDWYRGMECAQDIVEELPSADAVQGEWIVREYCTNELDYRRWIEIECPFCGEKPTYEDLDNMNYCPNCGARMKGGAEE